jgi:exodeoxyribonuclease V alpha subunit
VVTPVLTQHYAMLQRNLLYTGITRGKRRVVLVGQKKAIAIAVRNVSGRRRWSQLDEGLGLDASLATSMRRKRDEARRQRSKTAIRHILSLRRG